MLIDQWVWRYKTKKHPRNSGYVDQFAILGFPATRSFKGNFVRDPASYVGETYLVTDMDFAAMNLAACVEYLDRFIGEPIEKLFYAERHMPLELGVRWIEDDADYAFFLDTGYEEPDLPISMYIDHSGDGIADLFNSDNDESGGVTECEEERPTNDKEPVADDPI
ncbi:hypothetical protein LXL04_025888 [Taraxacum kok-saghyz]